MHRVQTHTAWLKYFFKALYGVLLRASSASVRACASYTKYTLKFENMDWFTRENWKLCWYLPTNENKLEIFEHGIKILKMSKKYQWNSWKNVVFEGGGIVSVCPWWRKKGVFSIFEFFLLDFCVKYTLKMAKKCIFSTFHKSADSADIHVL